MDIGLLWFDNDIRTDLFTKVERAADYYQEKYGKRPNLCFVHPSMVRGNDSPPEQKVMAGNVEIRATSSVLPNHFWIGLNGNVH